MLLGWEAKKQGLHVKDGKRLSEDNQQMAFIWVVEAKLSFLLFLGIETVWHLK